MNGTPNSKPLLTLTLVTLVVAVFVLGVVMWQTVLLDKQSRSLEERITAARQISTPIARPSKNVTAMNGGNFLRIQYGGPKNKAIPNGEPATHLYGKFLSQPDTAAECESFADLAGINRFDFTFEPESSENYLENETVLTYISSVAGPDTDVMIDRLKIGDFESSYLDMICKVQGEVWVSATTDLQNPTFYKWTSDASGKYFHRQGPVIQTVALSYSLYPDSDDSLYLLSAYGDAGVIWWRAYKYDAEAMYFDMVEDCTLATDIDGESEPASADLSCSRVYLP